MEQLIRKKFKMKNPTEQRLIKLGFRRNELPDGDIWRYYFTVYRYKNKICVIEGVVTVKLPDGKVSLDMNSGGAIFTPFYNSEYGNYEPLMEIVNKNFLRELKRLGIKEVKEKENE